MQEFRLFETVMGGAELQHADKIRMSDASVFNETRYLLYPVYPTGSLLCGVNYLKSGDF